MTEKDIDIAFVLLCRGHKQDKYSEAELADKARGFDTQNLNLLFPKYDLTDIHDSSSDNYEEEMVEDEVPSHKTREKMMEKAVPESMVENLPPKSSGAYSDDYEDRDDMIDEDITDSKVQKGTTPQKTANFKT